MRESPKYFKKRSRKGILKTEFSSVREMAGVTVTTRECRLPSGELKSTKKETLQDGSLKSFALNKSELIICKIEIIGYYEMLVVEEFSINSLL